MFFCFGCYSQMFFVTDPRTKGFAGGKLLGDKYMGFYYLQPHADFESKDIKADPMAFEIATAIVYHIARTTTLLGDQVLEVKELSKNKDIIFACGIFIRHLYILRNNQFNVSIYVNVLWRNISFLFLILEVFYGRNVNFTGGNELPLDWKN